MGSNWDRPFFRPCRDFEIFLDLVPQLKLWAMGFRPWRDFGSDDILEHVKGPLLKSLFYDKTMTLLADGMS